MKLSELFSAKKLTLSFEIFPPKAHSNYESVRLAAERIAALKPAYISVTYGAGGGTSEYTAKFASDIQKNYNVTTLAHLTCISSTRENVIKQINKLNENGIENILALRGDIPSDELGGKNTDYRYASQLIEDIKKNGSFCIGGACYPEGHTEASCLSEDIKHLKEKVDTGCDFLTTQMFLITIFCTAICIR